MSGSIDQPLDRTRAEDRRIIAAAWPMTDPHIVDRQFLDRGHRPPRSLQQSEQAACSECGIKALLLDGGADNQPSIAARHQVNARRPEHMIDQRRSRIHAQRQHLSLDRTDWWSQLRRQSGDATRPGAGRQHYDIGGNLSAISQHDSVGATSSNRNLLDRCLLADGRTGRLGHNAQCRHELAVIDLMIFRTPHRTCELAGEMRLAPPRLGCRNPLQWQPELLLKYQVMMNSRLVVGGQRNDQRTLGAQFDVDSGHLLQLGCKCWPARLALAPERYQSFLTRLGFRASCQHPGSSMAGAGTGGAAVKYGNSARAACQPPGNAKANDPCTDDDDVRF